MSSSLLKHRGRGSSGGKKLHWERAGIDGAPYRGNAPMLTDSEFEQQTIRVADVRNAFFDVKKLEENKLYLEVLECCMNGWFRLIHLERFWKGSESHYIEWAEFYLEDGSRTPFSATSIMELPDG